MELTRVSALECIGCLPDPVVSCEWNEDEAVGVALTELLHSVLQVVTQPVMLGCVPGVGGGLTCPWCRGRVGVFQRRSKRANGCLRCRSRLGRVVRALFL
jgi:hypothetical protein